MGHLSPPLLFGLVTVIRSSVAPASIAALPPRECPVIAMPPIGVALPPRESPTSPAPIISSASTARWVAHAHAEVAMNSPSGNSR